MASNRNLNDTEIESPHSVFENDTGQLMRRAEVLGRHKDDAVAQALASTLNATQDDIQTTLDRNLDTDNAVQRLIGTGTLTATDLTEPVVQDLCDAAGELGADTFAQSTNLGSHLGRDDNELSLYFRAAADLFDEVVSRLLEDAIDSDGIADGNMDPGAIRERLRGQIGSLHRLLTLQHTAVVDGYVDATVSSRVDDLEQELSQRRMIAKQVSASVDATKDENERVNDLAAEIDEETNEQTTDVEAISGEVSDLSTTTEEIASMADETSDVAETALASATAGKESGTEATQTMQTVDAAAQSVRDDIETLEHRISEIDDFVGAIDQISDQTNILALNASIEAARAGSAGDGFTVVADEVKELATDSKREADKIESMVEEIHEDTKETKASLTTTLEAIEEGTSQVQDAMAEFEAIAENIEAVATAISEVANAADEQAVSAEEVADMMEELDDKTRSISENASRITEGMTDQLSNIEMIASSVERISE